MMLEQHHDEETLIGLLEGGAAVEDAHLKACGGCRETYEALRDLSSVLDQPDVWDGREYDERPVAGTVAMLRAAADRLQEGVAAAEDLVEELTSLPLEDALALIRSEARYQTAGLARKLFDLSEAQLNVSPKQALSTSELAVGVAEMISPDSNPREAVALLRGSAYRHRGLCLFYNSRYPEAMEFYDRADRTLDGSVSGVYEKGRVGIHRTVIYANLERMNEAVSTARSSQRVFRAFGDVSRLASARFAEAYILMKFEQWNDALEIFNAIRNDSFDTANADMQARVYMNVAMCNAELGNLQEAGQFYYLAARLFEEAGTRNEAARMRWQIAGLFRMQGKLEEAVRRLDESAVELSGLGMVSEVASIQLEIAETLLTLGRTDRVPDLCRAAIRQYQKSGLSYSSKAMAALSYLEDVASQSHATVENVKHVKEYLRRLPLSPALLFAPLPDGPPEKG